MKPIWKSRTVQIAVLQAVIGVAIIVATEAGAGGMALILKSILDIALRYDTTEPIK